MQLLLMQQLTLGLTLQLLASASSTSRSVHVACLPREAAIPLHLNTRLHNLASHPAPTHLDIRHPPTSASDTPTGTHPAFKMPRLSERQSLLRDLFFLYMVAFEDEFDDIWAAIRRNWHHRFMITSPMYNFRVFNSLLSGLDDITDLLQVVLSHRYLQPRRRPINREEYNIARLFDVPDYEFKQAVRTTKEGFMFLLGEISEDLVFQSTGPQPQLPIPHQLALTLERLGSNGNGALIGRFSRNLNVGRGTVIKVTRRVIEAITNLGKKYVIWPNSDRRREISQVMESEGFQGCVGFVDGTTFPVFQRPGTDGEVFFDRKKRYSLNAQIICDCDKNIIGFIAGWPGSCADSFIFKKMEVWKNGHKFFDEGQYLLADSAYQLSEHVIPAYKAPANYIAENSEFNYRVAKARVRNEHTIGILKNRFASLKEIRLHLYECFHMLHYIKWVYTCIILHNMLANTPDSWDELTETDRHVATTAPEDELHVRGKEKFRSIVKRRCLLHHSG